jgi:hypothetical protein
VVLWIVFHYFRSVVLPSSTAHWTTCSLIMEFRKCRSGCWRFRRPHYVHFKRKNDNQYPFLILTYQYFSPSGKFSITFPAAFQKELKSSIECKVWFWTKSDTLEFLKLSLMEWNSTRPFLIILCISYLCLQGETWTGTEWLSGLHDGVETSEPGRSARRSEIYKECKYKRHLQ